MLLFEFATIRLLLALVAHLDLELHKMDVITAFLNGKPDEDIYMEQPEERIDAKRADWMCKLQKALYGLQQFPRKWHKKIDQFLIHDLIFKTACSDSCLSIRL